VLQSSVLLLQHAQSLLVVVVLHGSQIVLLQLVELLLSISFKLLVDESLLLESSYIPGYLDLFKGFRLFQDQVLLLLEYFLLILELLNSDSLALVVLFLDQSVLTFFLSFVSFGSVVVIHVDPFFDFVLLSFLLPSLFKV
jgi:hypothetical protein